MPQETNLNISPYFDDFDVSKNFYKILFKPSFPIQARELTGLQSVLQNQIEQFGNHVFKEGSVVIPGQINYNNQLFAVEVEPEFLGISLENYIEGILEKTITGSITNIKAKIVSILDEREDRGTFTFYLRYLSSGNNSETVFSNGETLLLDETISINGVIIQENQGFANAISRNASSIGSGVVISDGVYYIRGTFVNVYYQFLVLDSHSNTPSYRVGLEIVEEIITANDDESLSDNAQGFNNYAAPGADRLKISAFLVKKDISEDKNENFVELLEIREGEIRNIKENPQYNVLEQEIARRTYETSGDFYVNPFSISIKESLNNLKGNNGIFLNNQLTYNNNIPSENLATYKLTPGKAFVKGYEIDVKGTTYIDTEKPRTTNTLQDQSVNYTTGSSLTLNRVYGSPTINSDSPFIIELRNSRVGTDSELPTGKEIGLARVYDFKLQSGSYDSLLPNLNEWEISLFDLQTYTEFTLNENIESISFPTRIVGRSSGASGFLRYNASQTGIITAYNITGTFAIGEQLIFDSISETRISTAIVNYSISDVKSIYGLVGAASTFNSDVKLTPTTTIGSASITQQSSGISTITSSNFIFIGSVNVGDIVSYSTPGITVPSFSSVVTVNRSSLVITSVTSVQGVCSGSLPNSILNVNDLKVLKTSLNISDQNKLYTFLPKPYISSVNLQNSNLTIRKEYEIVIQNNSTEIIDAGTDLNFLPFDEGRYTLTRSNGQNEILTSDKFEFSSNSSQLRINGLELNDLNARLIATLRKVNIKSRIKNKNRVSSIIVDKSINASSGIGGTTLNDGLIYGNYPFGTRVQDPEICLLIPEVTKLYGIFESSDINAPKIPSLILSQITGPNAKTEDILLGEELLGSNSNAIAIVAEKINDFEIGIIYLNSNTFQELETVKFKESNIEAVIDSSTIGSKNITDHYGFQFGSENTILNYSKLIRFPKFNSPTKKIKILYESAVIPSSETGDITIVDSYRQFDYCDIPVINDGSNSSDILDIRPRVSEFSVTENVRSPFEFLGRTFNGTENSADNILASDESINLGFSYYLPRIDRIYLDTTGTFTVVQGIPSDFPELPSPLDNALEIANVYLSPYLCNTKDVRITSLNYKRYRMQDIHSLENRIKNLEFYTTLSLLESKTENLKIIDSNGLDRFKSGFFVDNFTTPTLQLTPNGIKNSIDPKHGELRPSHYTTEIDLILGSESLLGIGTDVNTLADTRFTSDLIGTGIKRTGQLLTLNYVDEVEVRQPFATRVENVTPFLVKTYNGSLELFPSSDIWVDTVRLESNRVEIDNFTATQQQLEFEGFDPQTGFGPINWDSWETIWTGRTASSDTSTASISASTTDAAISRRQTVVGRTTTGFVTDTINTRTLNIATTNTTTTTTENQSRSGQRLILSEITEESSQGDSVVSVDVISIMRSRNIEFISRGLKPFTQIYAFFDGVDVNTFIVPKLIEITMLSGSFISGETVIGSILQLGGRNNLIRFRLAKSNHKFGPILTPTDIYTKNPYSREIDIPSNYTLSSSILNVDTFSLSEDASGDFFGNIQNNMVLRGLQSNAEARISNLRLVTDNVGSLIGSFYIPNPNVPSNPTFETGTKTLKLTSSSTNSIIGGLTDTLAEENYFAQGSLSTVQERIISVRSPRFQTDPTVFSEDRTLVDVETTQSVNTTVTTESVNVERVDFVVVEPPPPPPPPEPRDRDPLAQSFNVVEQSGVFITKVDIFFQSKDDLLPVIVQLRTMQIGLPTQEILPFSEVFVYPSQINLSDNASIPTTIQFPSPIYLNGEDEYALVLLSDSNEYKVWISRFGEVDITTISGPESQQIIVSEQPNLGSLFKSQNGSTWDASQYEDLKFTLYKAKFTSREGIVNFFNPNLSGGNRQTANLLNDSLEFNSKVIRVGLGTTVQSGQIEFGNTIVQTSTNASANYIGVGGSAFNNLQIINPGIGYTPSLGSLTYNNVRLSTITGNGSNGRVNITIQNGEATSATISNGGSGYLVGDTVSILPGEIGSLGQNIILSISQISGMNELILDNVQGNFEVSNTKQLQYKNIGGNTVNLNSGGVYIQNINLVNSYNDGLHIKVNHKNHGMHSTVNRVSIIGVESDIPIVNLQTSYPFNSTGNISLSSTNNFNIFEGIAVSPTNPGYIIIDNEIISYTGIDNNFLIGIGRGIDQTNVVSHFTGDGVQKYEISGVSLRRINKIHLLQDTNNNYSNRDLDSYYIKLNMSQNGINRSVDNGSIPKLHINETKSSGGRNAYATQNIQYELIRPIIQTLMLPGTDISASVRTTTATSVSGSEVSFIDSGFTQIDLNSNNYFSQPRLVSSKINEDSILTNLPGKKSFTMSLNLFTSNQNLSPVIDLDRVGMIFTTNRVNSSIEDLVENGKYNTITNDPNKFVYLTKNIALENPATSIKVVLAAYMNIFNDIRVFYSISNNDGEGIYYPFPGYNNLDDAGKIIDISKNSGLPDRLISKTDVLEFDSLRLPYREHEFTIENLPSFKLYSIKIIGTSTNQSCPPRIRDFRAIALA
jgi:hypothetical protein